MDLVKSLKRVVPRGLHAPRGAGAGGLREVYFKERGWDDHQDVYGFVPDSQDP